MNMEVKITIVIPYIKLKSLTCEQSLSNVDYTFS